MGVPRPGRPDDVLRVMTYNVHDFLDDRAAAARVVRAVDPDVLCLQEVPRRLTTELRLPRFADACGMRAGGRRLGTGGTAVLTGPRVTVVERFCGRLPVRFPDRTRGWAGAAVSVEGATPVTVASVHLSLRGAERVAHARRLLASLGPAQQCVVVGDLNEPPGGPAFSVLCGPLRLVSGTVPTFPSREPTAVLDVVLAGDGLEGVPPAAGGRGPLEEDLVAASDHRPVWVDLLTR